MKMISFILILFFSVSIYADAIERINSITKDIQVLRLEKKNLQIALDKCNKKILIEKKTFNEFPKLKMKSNL
ncbi:hypothetical protein [Sulfurimonas sp.]|uniref:hypothetical protein n=1 Tax=Sulfurimonas sp. TaxID=2022749 RepID=UPI002636FFDF|nr:hypothetical protein [Sulfurimonas sp.]